MEMDDLSKKMEELMATHRENEAHLMRRMGGNPIWKRRPMK
jgi:hypothetical protein